MSYEAITVIYKRNLVELLKPVADELGLKPFQTLTEAEFWNAITADAEHRIKLCQPTETLTRGDS